MRARDCDGRDVAGTACAWVWLRVAGLLLSIRRLSDRTRQDLDSTLLIFSDPFGLGVRVSVCEPQVSVSVVVRLRVW